MIPSEKDILAIEENRRYKKLYDAFMAGPEASALAHILEVYSITPKSGASCQAFPGFIGLLDGYLNYITGLSNIVSDYACNPLTILLSVEKMLHHFDPNVFCITGCDYVTITWYNGMSVTINYVALPIILIRLFEVIFSRDGFKLLSNQFHNKLTLCFFGNITKINISRCLSLTNVLEFPALSCLTEINFSECLNLRQVPSELPDTVLSLANCFRDVPHVNGCQGWLTHPVRDFTDAFKGYRGAKFPEWDLSSAVSIRGIFDDARNIHPHGLYLYLPNCVDATKAFSQTTNLRENIVVYAPILKWADEMCDRQTLSKNIFLITSPEFRIHPNFACKFYSNDAARTGKKPLATLTRPWVISVGDVSTLKPKQLFDILSQTNFQTNFVRDTIECCMAISPPLTPKTVREKNIYGRMATKIIKPLESEVKRREEQVGVWASMALLKNPHEPCEIDIESVIAESIKQGFDKLIANIGWLYYKL